MLRDLINYMAFQLKLAQEDEQGIESIEWVALGAVLALTILAVGAILVPGGQQIGQTVLDGILSWASKIGGG
jgi:hypothetical protein